MYYSYRNMPDLIYRHRQMSFALAMMAFLMGLSQRLFIHFPALGTMPMFDIVCYALAPWSLVWVLPKMGKSAKWMFFFAVLWTCGAMIANWVNFEDPKTWWKHVVVASSSWTQLLIAWWVLKKHPRCYLHYMVGWALGGFIGMYYFKQGVYLAMEFNQGISAIEAMIDKQKYPPIAFAILFMSCLVPTIYIKKFPEFFSIVGAFIAGLFVLLNGGSRSTFGMFAAAGCVGALVAYGGRIARNLSRRGAMFYVLMGVGIMLIFGTYVGLAKSGAMGQREKDKYEEQYGEFGAGQDYERGLWARAGFEATFWTFLENPWGTGGNLKRHSVLANSWNCEGLPGLVFWLVFLYQTLWFAQKHLLQSGRYCIFLTALIAFADWECLGSPFGGRGVYFTLLALIVLVRDNPNYGRGILFNEDGRG